MRMFLSLQADKGEFGRLIDKISAYWTPSVLLAALLLSVVGGGITGEWQQYTLSALVLLVLACPCALVIAAPVPSCCCIAKAGE